MKKEYWDVEVEQVIEKTGKKISHWIKIPESSKLRKKDQMRWLPICRQILMYHVIGQEL
jgi:hypothetical protein